jgi:2-aminoadipate transaminase
MTTTSTEHLWSSHWATAVNTLTSSAIRELLKLTEQPGMISFAGGLPAPEAFPAEEIGLATERVLAQQAHRVLQYGPTEGFPPLRELIASLMQQRGLQASADDILLLSGSQQGLDVVGKLLIDPGAPVLVENPTYLGALQAWRPYQPQYVTLPVDDQGLQIDALEQALIDLERAKTPPRFLYTVATFQNPTGVTLSYERRLALLDLAERYDLPIIEDDPYGELRYDGTHLPTLAALDSQRHGEVRHVIYFSTFSKLLAPGLRVGWLVAPAVVRRPVVQMKQGLDLHTGTLAQAIAYESCRDGLLDSHVPRIRQLYHTRRDAMLAALERTMPAGVRWTRPEGGMFVWLTLPEGQQAAELLQRGIEQQVAFVPGEAFHPNGGGSSTFRLNFSFSPPAVIAEGVERLARAMREGGRINYEL